MNHFPLLVEFAQSYLKKQPFDIVHDLEHHRLVHDNCFAIISAEQLDADSEVMEVASWWHDVEKSYETAKSSDKTVEFLRSTAQELNIDHDFVEKCIHVIDQHSFSQNQTTLEGKILFDADKIEYVNAQRIEKYTIDIAQNPQKYSVDDLLEVYDIWTDRIKVVHERMHFPYSKGIFAQKLDETKDSLERFLAVAKEL